MRGFFITAMSAFLLLLSIQPALSDDWSCADARPLGSAPTGYIVPIDNHKIITDGPGEGLHSGVERGTVLK
jgi:hypothetical protein